MVHHFLYANPYKMSMFERSVTCSFFRNCTQILTRTEGKKFEDMFLVKMANKGTSLKCIKIVLLEPFFLYCEIQDFHTFLGLRNLDPPPWTCWGAYSIPRPPAVFSNDLRSLHIVSKTRLSTPHLLGGNFLSVFCRGGRRFFYTNSSGKLHPPTHTEKNDTSPTVTSVLQLHSLKSEKGWPVDFPKL